MNLIIALFASALAGAVGYLVGAFIATTLLGFPVYTLLVLPDSRMLLIVASIFGAGIVLQLLFGALVFLALKKGGLFNLPAVLLVYFLIYFVPLLIFGRLGGDTENSLIVTIPYLTWLSALAVVGWFFASSRKSAEA